MGWKSTIEITRQEAIFAIVNALKDKTPYSDMTNEELENMMYELNIGDELGLPYFGHNFIIKNTEEEINNS